MALILTGYALVFVDISVSFGVHVIDFAPDFIGYILLIAGFSQLMSESGRLKKLRGFATFMVLYSAAVFLLDALGLTVVGMGAVKGFIDVAAFFVPLYLVFVFIYAVRDIEIERHAALGHKALLKAFTPLAVTQSLAFVFSVAFADLPYVASIVASVFALVFLFFLWRTKTAYAKLPPKDNGSTSGEEDKKKTIWEQYN
ncbi:MAG: hypothetical protein IKX92_02435 [Clostridia bacterium]|nr:hypothetical protein [Clostridia bacterium]